MAEGESSAESLRILTRTSYPILPGVHLRSVPPAQLENGGDLIRAVRHDDRVGVAAALQCISTVYRACFGVCADEVGAGNAPQGVEEFSGKRHGHPCGSR